MKLYDGGRAPNPRRVRIFLKEKGIEVPIEPVDLGAMQHKSERFTAVNPLQRVPALELDDGTILTEVDRDLPLFRGAASASRPCSARSPVEIAPIEMWQRRIELHLMLGYRAGVPAPASRHEGVRGAADRRMGRGQQGPGSGISCAFWTGNWRTGASRPATNIRSPISPV